MNALLGESSEVLDFGAGRGLWATEPLPALHKRLRASHERVAAVHGVDVDPVVLDNPTLASAQVITPGEARSFPDTTSDLVLADLVLEHVAAQDAEGVAAELLRVLKHGGWLVAVPQQVGSNGLGARAVPNELHTRVLRRLQPSRKAETSSRSATARTPDDSSPGYSGRRTSWSGTAMPRSRRTSVDAAPVWRVAQLIDRLTPPRLAPTLMIFVRKSD